MAFLEQDKETTKSEARRAFPVQRRSGCFSILKFREWFIGALLIFSLGLQATPSMGEYQVKALFLFNFLKYVDWPEKAFTDPEAPILIGIIGDNPFGDDLKRVVEGKLIGEREVIVRQIDGYAGISSCHLLFISRSERNRLKNILETVNANPILTVGEDDTFLDSGGIINFVVRNGNVRLEINLPTSQHADLSISSRLLKVADVVKR